MSSQDTFVVPCVHKKHGPSRYGLTAHVVVGKSVTLVGETPAGHRNVLNPETGRYEPNAEPLPIRRTFKLGDEAECHSYNLVYTGVVRGITAKTVTVVEYEGSNNEKVYRMTHFAFAEKNWDFDGAAVAKRNAAEMMCI